eukprot:gnl/Spiro4/24604_TR12209_c0_g1_i1.p2 gnl/Spiro4/24604_TR12209_c0_g1~~gnl/Spiro4/24604_TR12209_c0_g1_i1.p2  ORF type:complete len:126 (+),score=24.86 gnl/Spiro4/24604_TR12209_c0_g1_i1:54-380(+)
MASVKNELPVLSLDRATRQTQRLITLDSPLLPTRHLHHLHEAFALPFPFFIDDQTPKFGQSTLGHPRFAGGKIVAALKGIKSLFNLGSNFTQERLGHRGRFFFPSTLR